MNTHKLKETCLDSDVSLGAMISPGGVVGVSSWGSPVIPFRVSSGWSSDSLKSYSGGNAVENPTTNNKGSTTIFRCNCCIILAQSHLCGVQKTWGTSKLKTRSNASDIFQEVMQLGHWVRTATNAPFIGVGSLRHWPLPHSPLLAAEAVAPSQQTRLPINLHMLHQCHHISRRHAIVKYNTSMKLHQYYSIR